MNLTRNIILLELYTFFSGLLFIVPVIVPYYKDHIGLSFHDFIIGEVVFATIVFSLEVPSGWLSDIWKRKHVLCLAMLAEIAGFLMLLFASNLIMAISAQAILGIAISLFSGTNSAMLYDSLLELDREHEFNRLEGKRLGLSLYAIAGASIVGGFLYELSPSFPIILTLISLASAGLCSLLMIEPNRHKSLTDQHPLADMLSTMRYSLRGHADVGLIALAAAILFSCTKLIMWAQQPYYMALGLPEAIFGILMAIGYGLGGVASHISHRIGNHLNNIQGIALAWALSTSVCFLSGAYLGLSGVGLLMIGGSFVYGMTSPRINSAINKRVGSERRATILSTVNLLRSLFFIPLGLIIGRLVDVTNIQVALLAISFWLCFAGIVLTLFARKVGSRSLLHK